jgi:predicted site-specific integrase-resolvase
LLGVHVATIDRWVKEGHAAPGKAGREDYRFDAVEINNWLAERRGKVA